MSAITLKEIDSVMTSVDTHLGRQNLSNLEKNAHKINQINFSTGESETHGSVRLRSIRAAQALTSRGIGLESVLMLCGTNHLDILIPVISSTYIGTAVMSLSVDMVHTEIRHHILIGNPDIIFCDAGVALKFLKVITELNVSPEIVVFGEKPPGNFTSFQEFLKPTGTEDKFQATDFNPSTVTAFIVLSSGSTGMSKGVCLTHQNLAMPILLPEILGKHSINIHESVVVFSSYVWFSGVLLSMVSTLLGVTRIQSHLPFAPEAALEVINKYKPYSIFLTPTGVASLLKHPKINECDFSSLHTFACGGSYFTRQKFEELQKYVTNGRIENYYGMTETGIITNAIMSKPGSCGEIVPWCKWKVVDPETREEVGPHKVGELLLCSPWTIFKCYYNNPEGTAAAFDGDWYRSGDLVYYDEEEHFFIVDRLKDLLKFRNIQIAPVELEREIVKIPGVYAVCVVGLPNPDDGDHPAAFVQLLPGSHTTAEDIKNVVKKNLSDAKQLRGGVVFLDELPATYSGKVNRKALNENKMKLFKNQS